MTSQQKLQYIIEKAIEGGWKDGNNFYIDGRGNLVKYYPNPTGGFRRYSREASIKEIIFNHEFAKSLWGEEDKYYKTDCNCDGAGVRVHPLQDIHSLDCAKVKSKRGYIYHLQQAVISPEPIKYIYESIKSG